MPPSINRLPLRGFAGGTQKSNLNHLLNMCVMKREDCRIAKTWRSVDRCHLAKRLGVRRSSAVFRRTKSDHHFQSHPQKCFVHYGGGVRPGSALPGGSGMDAPERHEMLWGPYSDVPEGP